MPSSVYRDRLIQNIRHALGKFEASGSVEHSVSKGTLREIFVGELLEPLLPPGVEQCEGVIVDSFGNQSRQTDIIIYDRSVLPPLIDKKTGFVPVESVLYTIEVKSVLTATEVQKTIKNGRYLESHLQMISGKYDDNDKSVDHDTVPIYRLLFAYSSDLKTKERYDSEFERIRHYEKGGKRGIDAYCVVGNGYYGYDYQSPLQWGRQLPTEYYDEVIAFLYLIVHAIPYISASRGKPRFGHYIWHGDWKALQEE